MERGIRIVTAQDAEAVTQFFTAVYETRHGAGTAQTLRLLERTLETLFPAAPDRPTVFAYDAGDGAVQGVAAVRGPDVAGAAELITVQVFDTVQGKGIGQTLLRRTVEHVRAGGATLFHTVVEGEDVRARGFLRREGFVAEVPEGDQGAAQHGGLVRYVMVWPSSAT